MTRPPVRYTRTADGVNLAYQVVGDGPRDILFFGSWFGQIDLRWEWNGYRRWLERLGSIGRLIVFDKRGMGASDPAPVNSLTLESWAEDGLAVMDAVGSERVAAIAWTDASSMALLFAAAHPDRVDSLTIVNRMRPANWRTAVRPLVWGEEVVPFLPRLAPSAAGNSAYVDWFVRMQRATSGPGPAQAMHHINIGTEVNDVLRSVSVPTLFVVRDGILPLEMIRSEAALVPGSNFVSVPGQDLHVWAGDVDPLIDEVETFITGLRPSPTPTRALLTLLFTDIVGSTALAAQLGDRPWRNLLDAHNESVRRAIRAHGGREAFVRGDEFLVVFDGPARAARCAQAIHEAAQTHGLEMRSGLHIGEVELHDNTVAGIAVHVGARIRELANPGEILASRTIKDLVAGSGLTFESRGTHELRGINDSWEIYAVASQ